jgi:mono/diheme cytochrome c family protein
MKTRLDNKRILLFAFCLLPFAFLATACRQDMHDQPKYEIYEKSNFDSFKKDESASRPIPANTVARGHLNDDTLMYTGKSDQTGAQSQSQGTNEFSGFADTFPFEIKTEDIKRGGERFNIYCSVCHDRTGSGQGMVVKRGYKQPPSFHTERLRGAPAGYLFDVITRGFGAMPDYSAQIQPRDRWLIVAYIRALQLSQNTKQDELSPEEKSKVQSGEATGGETKAGKGETHQ